MIVVVIHWKIKSDRVSEFLEFWKTAAIVDDRKGLIGEFLSEGHSTAEFNWITWPLTGCEGKYRSFVMSATGTAARSFRRRFEGISIHRRGLRILKRNPVCGLH